MPLNKEKQLELNAADRQRLVQEGLPNAFMNFIIGNGFWLNDKIDGTYRNYLIVSHQFGFTPEEVLLAHDIAVARSQGYYLSSASAKTLSGQIGATGLLPMMVASRLLGPTQTVISSARAGLVTYLLDSLFSASIKPTPKNVAFHAVAGVTIGTVSFGAFKAGEIVYKSAVLPAASAFVDCARFRGFNKYFQEELYAVGKQIAYKQLSFLAHGVDYTKGSVHSAITGALGEANVNYVLEKVLVKRFDFTRMVSKYDAVHGFDGLYVKLDKLGNILQVVFAESKASSRAFVHGLSRDVNGIQQLSRAHIKKTLDSLKEVKPCQELVENVITYLETEANWKNITRFVAKTNGSGWTQWHEAVGGLVDGSQVVLKPLTDSFKLIQKNSNTLTLKRRAAAGLLAGVAASNAYCNPEYADTSIDIIAPIDAQMTLELYDKSLDGNFPHDAFFTLWDTRLQQKQAKQAAEKAALKKAALEKAALEKASLEKAAAERVAAERAAAARAAHARREPFHYLWHVIKDGFGESIGGGYWVGSDGNNYQERNLHAVWLHEQWQQGKDMGNATANNHGGSSSTNNNNDHGDGPGNHQGSNNGGSSYNGCGSSGWDGSGGQNNNYGGAGGDLSCSRGDNGGMSCRRG